jgi:hypothetical protein
MTNVLCASSKEMDSLLEKINQAPKTEKKVLIESLKKKLAASNKKAQEEADAIIKAKQKMPLHPFVDKNSSQ